MFLLKSTVYVLIATNISFFFPLPLKNIFLQDLKNFLKFYIFYPELQIELIWHL